MPTLRIMHNFQVSMGDMHKDETFRLVFLHKSRELDPEMTQEFSCCLLYYNKKPQKNQELFLKFVLTAQNTFYII